VSVSIALSILLHQLRGELGYNERLAAEGLKPWVYLDIEGWAYYFPCRYQLRHHPRDSVYPNGKSHTYRMNQSLSIAPPAAAQGIRRRCMLKVPCMAWILMLWDCNMYPLHEWTLPATRLLCRVGESEDDLCWPFTHMLGDTHDMSFVISSRAHQQTGQMP